MRNETAKDKKEAHKLLCEHEKREVIYKSELKELALNMEKANVIQCKNTVFLHQQICLLLLLNLHLACYTASFNRNHKLRLQCFSKLKTTCSVNNDNTQDRFGENESDCGYDD